MEAIIMGNQKVDYTTKDGVNIKGVYIFVSHPDENVVGECCEKFFLNQKVVVPENIKIGDTIIINFNRWGKVESISKK